MFCCQICINMFEFKLYISLKRQVYFSKLCYLLKPKLCNWRQSRLVCIPRQSLGTSCPLILMTSKLMLLSTKYKCLNSSLQTDLPYPNDNAPCSSIKHIDNIFFVFLHFYFNLMLIYENKMMSYIKF